MDYLESDDIKSDLNYYIKRYGKEGAIDIKLDVRNAGSSFSNKCASLRFDVDAQVEQKPEEPEEPADPADWWKK
jgi:hypothetical protein